MFYSVKLPAIAGFAVAAMVIGCGGGGSSAGTSGSLSCGPNYLTPNYTVATDPGNGEPNFLLTWAGFPLRVHFENNITYDNNGSPVAGSDIVLEAAQRWIDATGGSASLTTTNQSANADIVVRFNDIGSSPGPGSTLGTTQITYYPSNNTIARAVITMNYWPGMTQAEFMEGFKHTAAHEVGHALFLQGHSDHASDVMFYQGSTTQDSPLTTRDSNSLVTAYCGNFRSRNRSAGEPLGSTKTIEISCAAR